MPDITMCENRDCPARERCYRYRAFPSPMKQSYGFFLDPGPDGCGHFWPAEGLALRPMAEIEAGAIIAEHSKETNT